MHGTGTIIYRPPGWTEDILLLPIELFAERAKKSRRQIDRKVESGELEKVLFFGLSCIPTYELRKFSEDSTNAECAVEHTPAGSTAKPESETESQAGRTS